jgi:hypothetical protein
VRNLRKNATRRILVKIYQDADLTDSKTVIAQHDLTEFELMRPGGWIGTD